MASPFKVFRRYQKILLVVAGVALMVAFSFGPVFSYLGGGGSGTNPVVVESSYGPIRKYELQHKVQMRDYLNSYLQTAFRMAHQLGGKPSAVPRLRPATKEDAVRVTLLAKKAQSLGFQVSDRAINNYLKQITGNAVSKSQFLGLLDQMVIENSRVSDSMIFEALRENLLAAKLEESYLLSAIPTPAQRWKYFLRLNDLVTVELLPLPVAQFLDQVPAPSEPELEKFFNKHKDSEQLPHIVGEVLMESPTPGFRRPRMMGFAYVKAEYDAIVERVADEITDEAIEQHYEANKHQFTRTRFIDESEPKTEPPQGDDATEKEPGDAADAGDAGDAATKDAEGEAPTEEPADAAEEPSEEEQAKPDTDKANEQPAQPEAAADGQFFSVADDVKNEEDAPASEDSPADAEAPAPSDPAGGDGGEVAPAAPSDSAEATATEEAATEEAATPATSPAKEKQEPDYLPLVEVKDDIRKELARQAAAERLRELLTPLETQLRGYSRRLASWQNLADDDPKKQQKPTMPDMKSLADAAGLELHETPLLSEYKFSETPLGESIVAAEGVRLFTFAFGNRMKNSKPTLSIDVDGNGYVAWVFQEQESAVPRLEDIREEVVRAYKMTGARKLALEESKRLARQAQTSGKPLQEQFADRKDPAPFVTDPFAWLTQGAVPQGYMRSRPRLSTVDAKDGQRVEGADVAFMQVIFGLNDGEVGVAINHAQSMMYVARIASHEATRDQLHEHFLDQPGPTLWLQLARGEVQQEVQASVWKSLKAEAHYKEVLPLDDRRDL